MYFDRFDIISAYYLAFTHCHGGQWSEEYKRLCHMQTYYWPSPSMEHIDGLSENAQYIYEKVVRRLIAKYHAPFSGHFE